MLPNQLVFRTLTDSRIYGATTMRVQVEFLFNSLESGLKPVVVLAKFFEERVVGARLELARTS